MVIACLGAMCECDGPFKTDYGTHTHTRTNTHTHTYTHTHTPIPIIFSVKARPYSFFARVPCLFDALIGGHGPYGELVTHMH